MGINRYEWLLMGINDYIKVINESYCDYMITLLVYSLWLLY